MDQLKCENCGRTNFHVYSSNITAVGMVVWTMCETPFSGNRSELPASYDSHLCMRYIGLVVPWEYMRMWQRPGV